MNTWACGPGWAAKALAPRVLRQVVRQVVRQVLRMPERRAGAALVCAAVLAAAVPGRAVAQSSQLQPSAELACLVPALQERVPAEYPLEMFERKLGAHFEVELRFFSPRRAPQMKVLRNFHSNQGPPQRLFLEAVERYVEPLRLPCMKAGGGPVVLRQTFQFVPNDGRQVSYGEPQDEADLAREQMLECFRRPGQGGPPDYPREAARRGVQGTVVARLTFSAPDQPPELEILGRPAEGASLETEVRRWLLGARLPCHEGEPVKLLQFYVFKLDQHTVLKDMSLSTLAGAMRRYPAPAFFDTAAMQCPFELRVTYNRPYGSNQIGELGEPVVDRRAFLQWLARVELQLPDPQANRVLGQSFNLSVPCTRLDIRD